MMILDFLLDDSKPIRDLIVLESEFFLVDFKKDLQSRLLKRGVQTRHVVYDDLIADIVQPSLFSKECVVVDGSKLDGKSVKKLIDVIEHRSVRDKKLLLYNIKDFPQDLKSKGLVITDPSMDDFDRILDYFAFKYALQGSKFPISIKDHLAFMDIGSFLSTLEMVYVVCCTTGVFDKTLYMRLKPSIPDVSAYFKWHSLIVKMFNSPDHHPFLKEVSVSLRSLSNRQLFYKIFNAVQDLISVSIGSTESFSTFKSNYLKKYPSLALTKLYLLYSLMFLNLSVLFNSNNVMIDYQVILDDVFN